jgi:hypothetical protein
VCWAVAGCSLNLRWPQFSPGSFVLLYVKLECQLLYSNLPKNAEVGIFPLIYSDKLYFAAASWGVNYG